MLGYIMVTLMTIGMLIVALKTLKYAARGQSNNLVGFRTKASSYSQITWEYANLYCAALLNKFLVLHIVIAIFGALFIIIKDVTDEVLLEYLAIVPAVSFLLILLLVVIFTQIKTVKKIKEAKRKQA